MDTKTAVLNFIEAANALRSCEEVEIGYVLVDLMREIPIKTSYAIYGVTEQFRRQVCSRLPEGSE